MVEPSRDRRGALEPAARRKLARARELMLADFTPPPRVFRPPRTINLAIRPNPKRTPRRAERRKP